MAKRVIKPKSKKKATKPKKVAGVEVKVSHKPEIEKPVSLYNGGQKSFDLTSSMYDSLKIKYRLVSYGATREIHYNGHVLRFAMSNKANRSIGACCLSVMRQVEKFVKEHGVLYCERRTTFYRNGGLFTDYIIRGGRELVMVDIKACYWTIAYHAGIINEKTYYKYLGSKDMRLFSIGNLKKSKRSALIQGGRIISGTETEEKNQHEWVWNYVVYVAYELFTKINDTIGRNAFMFKTDCVYASPEHLDKICEILKEEGFEYKVEKMTIKGHNRTRIVMEDEDGDMKISTFGCPNAVTAFLNYIEVDKQEHKQALRKERLMPEMNEDNEQEFY